MNHKLRVLVRVDVDPGHVTLEVTGCLTQENYPALLHIMRRASRLAAGSDVSIDLHGASHLDPEILLYLRQLAAGREPAAAPEALAVGLVTGAAAVVPGGTEAFRLRLQEPAELPICLLHVGSDGEVLAGLDGEISAAVNGRLLAEVGTPDGAGPAAGEDLIDGLELSDYFEGTLDPAATVLALSDGALGQLADALYRHLDTPSPSFGAHTWYELAAEELQQRYRAADAAGSGQPRPEQSGTEQAGTEQADTEQSGTEQAGPGLNSIPDGPAEGELAAGPAVA